MVRNVKEMVLSVNARTYLYSIIHLQLVHSSTVRLVVVVRCASVGMRLPLERARRGEHRSYFNNVSYDYITLQSTRLYGGRVSAYVCGAAVRVVRRVSAS